MEEASRLAKRKGTKAGVLMAGGTDVISLLKIKVIKAETVIDIKGIPGLEGISLKKDRGIKIGALTRLFDIQTSKLVKEKCLQYRAHIMFLNIADRREKRQMVGNICNASPSR